jgi:hypothetical protein
MARLQIVRKFIKDILTCKDNNTFDCGRAWLAFSIINIFGIAYLMIYKGMQVDLKDIAIAVSGVAAAFGWQIKLKQDTEPGQ